MVRRDEIEKLPDGFEGFWITSPSFPDEEWQVLKGLPQHFGLQVSGPQSTDASLEYLKDVELLDYLMLEKTSVTDQGGRSLVPLSDLMCKGLDLCTSPFFYPN